MFKFTNPITHSGQFHADEVCACAFLRIAGLIDPTKPITRSVDQKVLDTADILIDIGWVYDPAKHRYDHHQAGFTMTHPCGTPYAALGLIVKHFYQYVMDEATYQEFDRLYVRLLDGADTGKLWHQGKVVTFQGIISGFMPLDTDDAVEIDKAFHRAVDLSETVLRNQIAFCKHQVNSKAEVRKAVAEHSIFDGRAVIIPSRVQWKETIAEEFPNVKVVIFEHLRGGWAAQVAPKSVDGYDARMSFPESWAALKDKDLEKVTGITGSKFCHKARYLACNHTYEGLIKMVEVALKQS